MLKYSSQRIDDDDIDAVCKALRRDTITQGDLVIEFETALQKRIQSDYCLTVSSATSGLYIVYKALGLGPGDVLWTTSVTFIATANAAVCLGAKVGLVDIDLANFNLCPFKLEIGLKQAIRKNSLPKILTVVHMAGVSCRMKEIREICDRYGVVIVEDASHALGAYYENLPVGSCIYSSACVFSLHAIKSMTTGEGGVVCTNSEPLAQQVRTLRNHGLQPTENSDASPQKANYYFTEPSLNFRSTDIAAALGISQLSKLDKFMKIREQIALFYDRYISNKYVIKPETNKSYSANHLYIIRTKGSNSQESLELQSYLKQTGILVGFHYVPLYRLMNLNVDINDFQESERYYETALSLPIHCNLSSEDTARVVKVIHEFYER